MFRLSWVATSSGVPLRSTPPAPVYGPSVPSRTTSMLTDSGRTPASGVSHPRVEPDRAQVDVLVELEPEPEQQPALEHAAGHGRVADRAEQDRVLGPDLLPAPNRAASPRSGASAARRDRSWWRRWTLPAAWRTLSASATTSGPMPSPPITASLIAEDAMRVPYWPAAAGDAPPLSRRSRATCRACAAGPAGARRPAAAAGRPGSGRGAGRRPPGVPQRADSMDTCRTRRGLLTRSWLLTARRRAGARVPQTGRPRCASAARVPGSLR